MPDAIARVTELSEKLIANSEAVTAQARDVVRQLQDILVNVQEGNKDGDVR